MEKYFEIDKSHRIYSEYFEWLEDKDKVMNLYKEFAEMLGIEATEFIPRKDVLGIVLKGEDNKKFGKYLRVPEDRIRYFKKNSSYANDWARLVRERELKILRKPNIAWYINAYWKASTRLFDVNGKLYGSFECERVFELPDEFTEMKASEFYKIIEDLENGK